MPNIGGLEILLVLLVVLLLFGAKRLPDLSRSVGRSLRILRTETRALHAGDNSAVDRDAPDRAASDRPADAVAGHSRRDLSEA